MSEPRRTIAIVGAGFSGTVVAANLLAHPRHQPLRILLVDRSRVGRGIAYAARDFPYLLNVPAARMSASSHAPLEFLQFARHRFPDATEQDFLPRALYGEYLEWLLRRAELSAPPHVELVRVQGEVNAIRREHAALRLELADGRAFGANQLVLAVGNAGPAQLPGTEGLVKSERYVSDPWRRPNLIGADETVLLLGTGLTMADVVLAADEKARGLIRIHALSRHGWLPAPQPTPQEAVPSTGGDLDTSMLLEAAAISSRRLCSAVRNLATNAQARGGSWHDAINSVRQQAPKLWHALPITERRRFLRHLRTLWDIHRHRLPQSTLSALNQLRNAGVLQVHAGRLQECELLDGHIRVTWRPRGSAETSSLKVDRIINCTGTDRDVRRLSDPFWKALLSEEMICPDPLGLGIRTSAHGAVVNTRGMVVEDLFYVGPMLQATHWEATAVLELREHAELVARHLITLPPKQTAHSGTIPHPVNA